MEPRRRRGMGERMIRPWYGAARIVIAGGFLGKSDERRENKSSSTRRGRDVDEEELEKGTSNQAHNPHSTQLNPTTQLRSTRKVAP